MPKQFRLPLGDDEEADFLTVGDEIDVVDQLASDTPPIPASASSEDTSISPDLQGSYQRMTSAFPLRDNDVTLLALNSVRGIGLKTLRTLYEHLPDISAIWETSIADIATILQQLKIKDSAVIATTIHHEQDKLRTQAQQTLYRFRGEGTNLIMRHDPEFPERLAAIPDSPYWLFVEGDVRALQSPLIGIVGTRTPSSIGIQTAERLTAIVCREGFGVVSGLAEGIDESAHRVALYYRAPQVAVLGTGIDVVFPASTAGIRRRIVETGGAIISEYLPGDNYSRANFVQRNRIQAALSLTLVPVESQEQSGTAHTVRFATRYHRPMFGVVRGQPAPQNDMVAILRESAYPIFDIEQRAEIQALLDWLREQIPTRHWPLHRRQADGRSFFADIFSLIDDIIADVPFTAHDLDWLREQLFQRLNGASSTPSPVEQQRGH